MDNARNEAARSEKQSLTTAKDMLLAILCQAIGKGNVSRIRMRAEQAAFVFHRVEKQAGCPASATIGIDDRIRSNDWPAARFVLAIGREQSAQHIVVFHVKRVGEPQRQLGNGRFHRSKEEPGSQDVEAKFAGYPLGKLVEFDQRVAGAVVVTTNDGRVVARH